MSNKKPGEVRTAMAVDHPGRILPVPRLSTILAVAVIIILIWAFLTRRTIQFYASFVFLFYAITGSMWVSVIMLGVFQTVLLIPFRVVNLLKSANIKDFEQTLEKMRQEKEQATFLRKSVRGGRQVAVYYLVNFTVQLLSYISIGRLFLTDFYATKLDPWLLYKFVPYPDYPIQDRWFKIPYLWFSKTIDGGWSVVGWAWLVIILLQAGLLLGRAIIAKQKSWGESPQGEMLRRVGKFFAGSTVILMIIAYILIRNWPVNWNLRIFSGDVAKPNRTFNTLTAIVTTVTLIWINLPKIGKKVELARAAGIEEKVVWRTQKELFGETIRSAVLVGLGAFYVTNLIPCAFELSVFTLELISMLSPLTLDRMILSSVAGVKATRAKQDEEKLAGNDKGQEKENQKENLDETKAPENRVEKSRMEGEIKF